MAKAPVVTVGDTEYTTSEAAAMIAQLTKERDELYLIVGEMSKFGVTNVDDDVQAKLNAADDAIAAFLKGEQPLAETLQDVGLRLVERTLVVATVATEAEQTADEAQPVEILSDELQATAAGEVNVVTERGVEAVGTDSMGIPKVPGL